MADPFSPQNLQRENTFGRALVDRVAPMFGGGMAGQAASQLQSQPYMMHVREAQANGVKPMTPEEFQRFMQGQQLNVAPQLGR